MTKLIHAEKSVLIEALQLWIYKTDLKASELIRVVDCHEGFKVGVIDYIDPDTEFVSVENNQTEKEAKELRQRILEFL
tara:strand:- start:135 stop:368 length:234 start_codon:yes stop_codon:yes gene_type:complete